MKTPICDFASCYAQSGAVRMHMPGHKGVSLLGMEALDITEIDGADSLYEADGIIKQSEEAASSLFECPTLYSTEGSSQCIRAMLYLALMDAKQKNRTCKIAAGRNAHKTFLSAAALLDLDVLWMFPKEEASYLSCVIEAEELEKLFEAEQPTAVYVTSPDYLGHTCDIRALSEVCRRHDALLLVDNAHGAYLKFLPEFCHPVDLGADICCDSAHKTLPALTGGAYLHIRDEALYELGKQALVLFGSTSPSYLIMQSLDACNRYLADGYRQKLAAFIQKVDRLKAALMKKGYLLDGAEPLKVTICAKAYGYTGEALAAEIQKQGVVCEFADPDFLVLMLAPENTDEELQRVKQALIAIPRKEALSEEPPRMARPERVMTIREAMLSVSEEIEAEQAVGRVLSAATVGCPPAVPIVVCGERIDESAAACFRYYGINTCRVVL